MANKDLGGRAVLCHDTNWVCQGVEDDGMNLLVIGAGVVSLDFACELADAFIQASYVPCGPAFGMPPRRLARVVEYIRSHLDQPLPVSVLSRLPETSQPHFSQLFELSSGLIPHPSVRYKRT